LFCLHISMGCQCNQRWYFISVLSSWHKTKSHICPHLFYETVDLGEGWQPKNCQIIISFLVWWKNRVEDFFSQHKQEQNQQLKALTQSFMHLRVGNANSDSRKKHNNKKCKLWDGEILRGKKESKWDTFNEKYKPVNIPTLGNAVCILAFKIKEVKKFF
jgi:hypothetical protein